MRRLTVLFDPDCGLCARARLWLEDQDALVPLELVAAGSDEARRRFPALDPAATRAELCVVADDGRVWSGAAAWVVCLWALRRYRGHALRLARPGAFPLARRFVDLVSRNRYRVSAWLDERAREAP